MKKRLPLLLLLLLTLTACKTRHVEIDQNKKFVTTDHTEVKKQNSFLIDSNNLFTKTNSLQKNNDSAQLIITPDSGSTIKVLISEYGHFAYSGKAKNIQYKNARLGQEEMDKTTQLSNITRNHTVKNDSAASKTEQESATNKKTIIAQSGYLWAVILIIVFLIIIAFVHKFIRI